MNYLENDKTNTAIMLSGDWGCGKSYYIKNQLREELEKEGKDYVLVSLYGINKLEDVSKALYIEARASWLNKKSEKGSIVKFTAKTIIKGIASFFGVDLNVSQEDLQNIYNSIDFSNKLIILEDFERCPIDKVELLGYINNLVEQDGVKVLVVANEKEIISFEQFIDEKTKKTQKKYDEGSLKYLRIKEKTIGDTFYFKNNIDETITSILNLYENEYLTEIKNQYPQFIKEIVSIMDELKCYNLRSLIYACQKTLDMFKQIDWDADICFLRNVFLGNIAFCLKKKNKDDVSWNPIDLCSYDLASNRYPVYKFAYHYITFHYLNIDYFKFSEEQFKHFMEKHEADKDLSILYSYYKRKEKDVVEAINRIKTRLETDGTISIQEYPKLANYLISVKPIIGCDKKINQCKEIMIENVANQYRADNSFDIYFHDGIVLGTQEQKDEFNEFKQRLQKPISEKEDPLKILDYKASNIDNFCDMIHKNVSTFYNNKGFINNIDVLKFVEMLKDCSASQLHEIRDVFQWVYSISNIKEVLLGDKENLILLLEKIKTLKDTATCFDKIQKQQLTWFCDNIQSICDKLGE